MVKSAVSLHKSGRYGTTHAQGASDCWLVDSSSSLYTTRAYRYPYSCIRPSSYDRRPESGANAATYEHTYTNLNAYTDSYANSYNHADAAT